jgi:DNA/RNA endonuclease YhcR with UshA esterase domain
MKKKYSLFMAAVLMSFVGFAQTASLPIAEDFELETNAVSCAASGVTLASANFFNDPNDTDEWDVDNGGTGSSNTGPAMDHNPGTSAGKYLFTETSGCNNNTVNLNSTWMNWSTASTVQVDFWYHMFGTSQGTMHFDIRKGMNGAWQMDYIPSFTDNQDLWQLQTIYVCDPIYIADSIQIRIRNQSGTSFASDAAIDNISITALSPTVCLAPTSAKTSNITTTSIDLEWSQCNPSIKWDIEYGVAPLTPGTGTMVTTTNNPYTLTGLTVNTAYEYRVRNHCTATDTTAYTAMTPFFFPSPPLAGTYTVNSAAATLGTNFQTFADLAQSLNQSGISAPVTINVVVGSGPYTDQFVLNSIPGASATNTVTINGNGETLSYAPVTGDYRIVGFDGTSYVTLKNLTIQSTSSIYGYGIHLTGGSNHITIDSVNIDLTATTSTSSLNAAGIVASSSFTSATTAGNNADDITVSNSKIDGGATGVYYAVTFVGASTTANSTNINVINNEIGDFYAYGIYMNNVSNSTVSGNDIHRMNKTGVTTFYGIGTFGTSSGNVFNGNYIHDTHTSATSLTGTTYGMYQGSNDATTPNVWSNNALYDFNSDGTIYAIYNAGSDNQNYYHNSISLDHATAAGGITRGFYQTTTASGIDFKNNIISITRGGNGAKHAIYLNATASTVVSNYNNLYMGSLGSGAQSYGYYLGDQTSFNDWQAANSSAFAANSTPVNPMFTSSTDLTPLGGGASNSADPSVGVTTDITGATRGVMPDMGALEYNYIAPACPAPIANAATVLSNTSAFVSWTETAAATTWRVEWDTTGYATGTARNTMLVTTDTFMTITGLMPQTDYDWNVRAICNATDSSMQVGGIFTTFCSAIVAPYFTDFESDAVNDAPQCWDQYNSYDPANAYAEVRAFTFTNGPFAGTNALYMYNYFGYTQNSDTLIAISPQFSDLTAGDKQIRFQGNSDDPTTQLIVGTVASPSPSATFNPISTVTFATADVYQEVVVTLSAANGYNGTDQYIVFAHDLTNTFDYIRIDNFNYEVAPSCAVPSALTIDSTNATNTGVSWNENGTATEWLVEYDTAGFTAGTGRFSITVNTNPNTVITGLSPSTSYEFNVRAVCSAIDTSARTVNTSFATAFLPAQGVNCTTGNPSVIFTEEFDNNNAGWTGNIGASGGNWEIPDNATSSNTGADVAHSGLNYMNFEASGGSSGSIVTPAIDLTSAVGDAELSFWLHAYGADMGDLTVGVGTSATGPFTNEFISSGQIQTAGSDPWLNAGINLASYIGQTIYIEFNMSNYPSFTSDMSIDLVEVSTCASCSAPSTLLASNVAQTTADVAWTENGTATLWEVEYGVTGSGISVRDTTSSNPYSLSGLSSSTMYDYRVRAICGPADSSGFSIAANFTTAFQCPTGAECATYSTGDIPSDRAFTALPGTSTCPSAVSVTIPVGNRIDSVSTFYDMTAPAAGGGWISEQTSWLYSPATMNGEPAIISGPATNAAGTASYSRGGLNFANAATGTVSIEMHAGRTFGGTGCGTAVNKVDDGTWTVIAYYSALPACIEPNALSTSSVSTNNATLSWVEQGSATEWQIEYGPTGYTLGTGIDSIVNLDTFKLVNGLTSSTTYDWYVRAICAPTDTSNWSSVASFTTAFQCPTGAECATYTAMDIPTDIGFQTLPGTSTCPATVSVTIPIGNRIDSVSTFYDMTADAPTNSWQSEQRSWLYSPTTLNGEAAITNGPAINTPGTASYSRDNLSFANTATGTVSIEMHAGRTFGGTACGTANNKVDNGTWTVIAYYSPVPACVEPTSQATVSVGNDTALVSWVEAGTATSWQVEYGTVGYAVGTGTKTVVNVDTFTVFTGLSNATAYDWNVRAICAPTDTSNWTGANSFTTLCPSPSVAATLPFIEGWEANTGTVSGNANLTCDPSYSWNLETNNADGRARFGTDAVQAATGTGAVTLDAITTSAVIANDLILTINMSSFSTISDLELLFDFSHHGEEPHPNDSVWVRGSDTNPWVGIYDLYANRGTGGVYNSVGPIDVDAALTASGQSPSATFQVRFGQEDNFPATSPTASDGFSFDNIVLRQTPSCPAPILTATSVITTTTADISWTDTASTTASSYQYSYGPVGFIAGAGTQGLTSLDSVTVSGLMASTTYDWYVRSVCSSTDSSLWTLASTFTTLCVPFTAPFTESFNLTTTPNCWAQSAVSGGPWIFGNPGITWNTQACPTVPVDHTGNSGNFAALDFSVPDAGVVLELPEVNVSTLTAPYLEFYFTMCNAVTPANILFVEAFDGTTWNNVSTIQQGTNGWERFGFQVSSFIYNTNLVKVRFRAEDGGGTQFQADMGIDDVTIDEAPADEIAVTSIVTPTSGCGLSSTETVQIAITNNGSAAQTGFSVGYSLNGVAITPETFTASLPSGMTMNYSFTATANLSTAGVYEIVGYATLTGDVDNSNDTTNTSVVSASLVSSFPYNESFETGTAGWLVTGNANWELGVPVGTLIDTASDGTQAWVTDLDADYGANFSGFVNSPCLDFSGLSNPWINMDVWYESEASWDGSFIQSSIDGGATWQTIGVFGDPMNWYNDDDITSTSPVNPSLDGWAGSSAGWLTASNALSGLAGQPVVNLRVGFVSDGSVFDNGFAFDNVNIYDRDPTYAIDVLNTEDASGVADSIGTVGWTSGTVVGIDLDGNNGISFTIVDQSSNSQEGINVFNFNDVSGYVVTEGDSIMVRGTVGQFNGLTQISPDSIMVISTGNAMPAPIVVTDLDESTESKWLSIPTQWVSLSTSGAFSSNVDLTNGTDTITMRIDSDTDINDSLTSLGAIVPGDTICGLSGIGGQFDNSNPFTDGYQIFPMRWSDLTICRLVLPAVIPYYPIGTINTEDAITGVADSANVDCFTSGIVTGIDIDGNAGISFTIIDMSSSVQEGITIFNFVDVSNYVVTEGDSIMVRGYVDQFNGLTQIRVDSISIIATGVAIPAPIVVTDLDETTESKYLSIPTSWVSLSTSGAGSSNIDMTNGTDTITMRIDSDTDINDTLVARGAPIVPGDTICGIFGIGGQFDNSSPFTSGYQIFPMRWTDLTICRNTVGVNDVEVVSSEFMLVPNPTNGIFEIRSNGFNNATINISIRDISGRVITSEFVNNATGNFNKSFDLNGESKGVYFITIVDGENVINEKLILQ